MKVNVETKTTQIIDEKEEMIIQKGTGTIQNYEKGTILSWEIPNESSHFQMTILSNKILLKKQNQNMIFELGKINRSSLQTPYGNLTMNITTNQIEIVKEKEMIRKIKLIYDIQIEDTMKYQNKIEIELK